jgi:hypothetical protein
MSVKFQRDTYQQSAQNLAPNLPGRDGRPIPGTSGHHPFAEAVGTALTGGKDNAGTKGYLAVCACANGSGCDGCKMAGVSGS